MEVGSVENKANKKKWKVWYYYARIKIFKSRDLRKMIQDKYAI